MNTPMIGFPKRYHDTKPETSGPWYEAEKKVHKCLCNGGMVILHGGRGTGKTFMAYDLASGDGYPDPMKVSYSQTVKRPAIYKTAMKIFIEIRDTYRRDSEKSELQVMDELAGAVLLVVDEIHERGETTFEDQRLTAILDARYQDGRPTILIGNYKTTEDLRLNLSPSIASRMREGGGAIHCNWPSFRHPNEK